MPGNASKPRSLRGSHGEMAYGGMGGDGVGSRAERHRWGVKDRAKAPTEKRRLVIVWNQPLEKVPRGHRTGGPYSQSRPRQFHRDLSGAGFALPQAIRFAKEGPTPKAIPRWGPAASV